LGMNATFWSAPIGTSKPDRFQWAPTLGGECYGGNPLGYSDLRSLCFNGHPPLGVNATPVP